MHVFYNLICKDFCFIVFPSLNKKTNQHFSSLILFFIFLTEIFFLALSNSCIDSIAYTMNTVWDTCEKKCSTLTEYPEANKSELDLLTGMEDSEWHAMCLVHCLSREQCHVFQRLCKFTVVKTWITITRL